jgi:hypothetical protein
VDFINRVTARVRQHWPRVRLSLLAYNRTMLEPSGVTCEHEPDVHIGFRRCYNHGFGEPDCPTNSAQTPILNGWMRAGAQALLYEYYQTANLGAFPRVFPHVIAQDMRYLRHVGAAGTGSQSDPALWPSLGLNYYVYAKLTWNPDADVDEVIEDYCRNTFGVAGRFARGLFTLLEDTFAQGGHFFRWDWNAIFPLFTDEVRQQLLDLGQKAVDAAHDEEPAPRHQSGLLLTLARFVDLYVRAAHLQEKRALQELGALLAEHGKDLKGLDHLTGREQVFLDPATRLQV